MSLTRSGRFLAALLTSAALCGAGSALLGQCGPFSDVTDAAFCPFVLEIFYLGITTGTTATTYDPSGTVSRLQMAAFLSRSVDRSLARGGRRAILDQFWTTRTSSNLGLTSVGSSPTRVKFDGTDLWVSHSTGTVARVRPGDGKLLETWTGAPGLDRPLAAMGKIFFDGFGTPGALLRIDPSLAPGGATAVAAIGDNSNGIAFDGWKVWTSNGSSISIVTPAASLPWSSTTVTAGFAAPAGLEFDGANIWVADATAGTLLKLDAGGAVLQTVTLGSVPRFPVFDGTNLWVPQGASNTVAVVRPSSGAVLAILTGNGLAAPNGGAFDGQRVMITTAFGDVVSLWKAADLTPLGSLSTGTNTSPLSACSDGAYFWIVLADTNQLARF